MKTLISFVLLVALLHTNSAAQNLSGIWKGKMTVDTPRYDINFEMALDDKNGKLSGYITRTVVLNDTFFYSLVKVKATMREDRLVVEDVEMVSNNFPERRSGIKQTTVFFLDQWRKGVNVSILTGNWSTNRIKGFMGLSGVVQVERQENYVNTQIFRRMEDQNLLTSVSFIKPEDIPKKEQQMVAVAPVKPTDQTPATKTDAAAAKPTIAEPITKKEDMKAVQPPAAVIQKPAVESRTDTLKTMRPPTVVAQQRSTIRDSLLTRNEPKSDVAKTKPVAQPQAERLATQPATAKTETQPAAQAVKPVTQLPTVQPPANQPVIRPAADSQAVAVSQLPVVKRQPDSVVAVVQSRPAELINTFDVRSDSLVLALYDNGEIDGDTVSVFVNDQLVISKQGLSATAFRKTIYFAPGMRDSIKLVLYAENLGRIPPNTGLLLVNDGDLRYEVYFSANLKSSSAIILRRRKTD